MRGKTERSFLTVISQMIRQLVSKGRVSCEDLERAFEEFRGAKRGVRFVIADVIDLPGGCSALVVRPARALTENEKHELGVYVKAKLFCEMPKAVSVLKDRSLALIRAADSPAYSQDNEGRVFRQPAWYVRHAGGVIGPLSFLTDWDDGYQAFIMQLTTFVLDITSMSDSVRAAVIGRIARGYRKGVGTIEI